MAEFLPIVIATLSFATVAALVFVAGQYYSTHAQMLRRLPTPARSFDDPTSSTARGLHAFVSKHFDEKRFGVDSTVRGKLRRDLVKAGFFKSEAINYYIFSRVALVVGLPGIAYIFVQSVFGNMGWTLKLIVVAIFAVLAI